MGVIRPPWVSKKWFRQCPFNYCDHFGDIEVLASVCKICKDEVLRERFYKKAGKDPHDLNYVFKDITDSLGQTMKMVQEQANRLGIDLDNLPDDNEEAPPAENFPIYNLIRKYGNRVQKFIDNFNIVPVDADKNLMIKAVDSLAHSRFYMTAKIARALSSRWEEEKDPDDDSFDSKTSAFLAYIAMERNSRALLAFANHRPLLILKEKTLKFSAVSIKLAEMVREEFFSKDKLRFEEIGCDSYNEVFKIKTK